MDKAFRTGTDRALPLETTLARARALMEPLGITRVANVTGLDRIGIPVVSVFRPNSRSLVAAQGKGLSLAAAQASGLMESIESHHAEHVDLPLRRASYSELSRSRDVIDVSLLPRPAISRFGADVPILWVEGYDLLSDKALWVPLETVHLDYRVPLPTGSGCFFASSNGLASGNTPLEAINHGIFELVERDANTLDHLSPKESKRERRVDLTSVDDADCRSVLERFENAGIAVVVGDVTSDVGIASFLCCVADRNPNPSRPLRPIAGSGCHPRREIALLRALTEAAQGRLTTIAGSRDDLNASAYDRSDALARLSVFFSELAESNPNRPLAATPTRDLPSFLDDFQLALASLARAGARQVVAVDLSRAELGLPVVRIVVPGLEAMSETPHYTPGPRARRLLAEAS